MQSTGPNGEDGAASTLYKVFEAISKQDKYQQTATIKTLFGQWAIEGVSKIVGNLPAFQNALLMAGDTSAYSGSMEKELLVRLDTSEAVSQMASNATDRLLINVGNQFLPAKKELTLSKSRSTVRPKTLSSCIRACPAAPMMQAATASGL